MTVSSLRVVVGLPQNSDFGTQTRGASPSEGRQGVQQRTAGNLAGIGKATLKSGLGSLRKLSANFLEQS